MIFIIYLPKGRGGRGVTQRWGLGEIFGRFFGFVALYVLYRYDFYYISALIRLLAIDFWGWIMKYIFIGEEIRATRVFGSYLVLCFCIECPETRY